MTSEKTRPEGDPFRLGLAVVQRIGSWDVTMYRPAGHIDTGGPLEIEITPAPDGDPQEIARGITSTVLRQINTAAPTSEKAKKSNRDKIAAAEIYALARVLQDLPGRLTDEYLAVLSSLYVRAVDLGHRAPVPLLEELTDTKQATLKGHLRAARQRGFLTKVEGKAGGQLTDKAIEMLKGIDTEEVRQPSRLGQSEGEIAE
ncbi:hypothetical protein [Streptomyces sp. NPDC094032]|uniref:hypothetical protein n=1 Tax=Streptomyces sp. NPDC094032 TaxID=3155308 RepID=UPI00331DF282